MITDTYRNKEKNELKSQISSLPEYFQQYQHSTDDPQAFWEELATTFTWRKKWTEVFNRSIDHGKVSWFKNGQLNITENLLDRHISTKGNQIACIWEANKPGNEQTFTYSQLLSEVCKLANGLKSLDVKKGDRVIIYMPLIPATALAMLACARIGAIHSVVFAGFSAKALADRVQDADAKVVLTTDGAYRGAKSINTKQTVDEALKICSGVESVLVFKKNRP